MEWFAVPDMEKSIYVHAEGETGRTVLVMNSPQALSVVAAAITLAAADLTPKECKTCANCETERLCKLIKDASSMLQTAMQLHQEYERIQNKYLEN